MNGLHSNLEPQEPKALEKFPFLTGVLLDPVTGPFAMSRPVAVLRQTDTNKFTEINESVTEDIYSHNELDARYAQAGWPSPSGLPNKPGDVSILGDQPVIGSEIWASRRFMVQRVSVNLAPEDLRPVEPFVEAIEEALGQESRVSQIKAFKKVFATWGEVIPMNMVAGAFLATTGTLENGATLPDSAPPSNTPIGDRPYNLSDIVDRHLGTPRTFVRRLESRVQGGFSETLLNEGYEGWLKSVTENPTSWRVVKVNRVIPITDILSDKLRNMVERVFGDSLIYRSPSVGAPHGRGFECDTSSLRAIQVITVWYSDSRVRDISIKFVGGAVSGPYAFALSNPQSQSDEFILASGEYITDMFVWHHVDGWIAGLQFFKSSLECSPIYGIRDRELISTHAPVLLSGNGNALLGLSGTFYPDCICQIKAVWRGDVTINRYRHTLTSFTGALHGFVFNDLQHLADPATSRIVEITARAEGSLANLRTTYVSVSGGALVRSETPARGTDLGPLRSMVLEDDEYIIQVRGSHNHTWMHQIQFITNKKEYPPFGSDKGDVTFEFKAPKTIDGKDMVLHYMAGKVGGCVHSILFVWAEKPLQATDA
ncbi:hypothetical protein RSOLAG1IB_11226 [Rhizoctonia solani AG-1 IB]|uniref:Jacalin-type lectin domain-containing protein n=1 Tax=Thanatephorus cucumeris (strain AG1-IB / isolate 7/3/14) TaxID=1108050 RepID=A0A0B7F8A3_THACB|nr:hypothetical protein RSOLAG1IB_11226 [Rhizoctonia solani AG-1 IB]